MNFKKFISGVSAFAIAASAFAGMAVTANALDAGNYSGNADFTAKNRVTNNNDGTFKSAGNAGNQYALVLADLSGLEDIDKASAVTVEFDSVIPTGSRWLVGVGDKNTRGTTAATSNKGTYATDGLVMRFGTDNGSAYRVNGVTNNADAFDKTVHATVTLDRAEGKYSYSLTDKDNGTTYFNGSNIATSVSNITVVEAYSWANNSTVTMTNLTYSYTIPEEPLNPAGALTIKYVAGTNEIYSYSPDVSSNVAGQVYTYSYPAYYKVGDVYYELQETSFSKDVTFTTEAQESTVAYAVASDVVDFKEVNVSNYTLHSPFAVAAANRNASAGMDGGTVYSTGACRQTFNVPAAGDYAITVNAVGTASGNRSVYLNVDGTDEATRLGTLACNNGATAEQTVNVHLTAGEHTFYYVGTGGGISPQIDYMVVKLVKEDVPAEASAVAAGETFTDAEGNSAATYKFTVTSNDETVTSITVTADGATGEASQTIDTPVITNGIVNCAIIATYTGNTAPAASVFHVSIN